MKDLIVRPNATLLCIYVKNEYSHKNSANLMFYRYVYKKLIEFLKKPKSEDDYIINFFVGKRKIFILMGSKEEAKRKWLSTAASYIKETGEINLDNPMTYWFDEIYRRTENDPELL